MKTFTTLFVLFFFSASFTAQTLNVEITENTSNDSLVMPLSGVISGPLPPYNSNAIDITKQLQSIGITSIRNNDYYNDALDMEGIFNCGGCSTYPCWSCDPTDSNNYHWSLSDSVFESILAGGFEPFFRIGGEYECGIRNHDYKGPRKNEEDNYIRAAKKVVDRYYHWNGSSGAFEYLDLWTEYPNKTFWDRSDKEFESFWARLYDTLKTAFPKLKIGGPGFLFTIFVATGKTSNPKVLETIDFLNYLYEHNIKPDWIGWHLFNISPSFYYDGGKNMRHLLNGTDLFSFVPWAGTGFFEKTELICDAYYLSKVETDSLGENPTQLPAAVINKNFNKQEGSAKLSAVWMNLQMTDTKRAYYYRANDPSSAPNQPLNSSSNALTSGLVYGDSAGTIKPVGYAFKLFARLYNNYPYLLKTKNFSTLGKKDSLWALAAEDRKGNYALLVSNVDTDNPIEFSLKIKNVTVDTNHFKITYRLVNNNENGGVSHPQKSSAFRLKSMNVALIEFKKKTTVSVKNNMNPHFNFTLKQNYPNPFNPETTIKYSIPQKVTKMQKNGSLLVTLKIYDVLGREIQTLVNKQQKPGNYSVKFNAANLPSGVYFYTLRAGDYFSSKKMLLMK